MKKIASFFLAVLLLLCCSCGKKEKNIIRTADMLSITNEEKSFLGCKSRYEAVLSAMKTKITVLENAHNTVIMSGNKEEYFLDENYILTSFEPFILSTLSITENFTPDMTNEKAQDTFKIQSEGMDINFSSKNDISELMFVSESLVKTYTAEYDKKNDSLKYSYTVESGGEETVEEFVEFRQLGKNTYIIQSRYERCYIEFDKNGEIIYFCCGKLNEGEFSADESIFTSTEELDNFWVISRGKSAFSNIHTFENEILTHEDRSSGPWKTIKINAVDYESAFYGK
ncbi:MAG: hypothetical protein U0L11_08670 [Acutalibacteraceae bacterium]|nr:hypothetical protein [Acutalibacteraceae bacterium]